MHQNGLYQWRSKCTQVQHAPHASHHSELAFCLLQQGQSPMFAAVQMVLIVTEVLESF